MAEEIKGKLNPKVDLFFNQAKKWQKEFSVLREIILYSPLTEDLKWGVPCYMYRNKNIILIHGFKEYCAVLFFKGALLKDHNHILVAQTENVQAARQIRFANVQDIVELETVLKVYLAEAIEVERTGLKVHYKKPDKITLPEEFVSRCKMVQGLRQAFDDLTPGRQRVYSLYFSAPKLSKTRESRVEKCIQKILSGKGLND